MPGARSQLDLFQDPAQAALTGSVRPTKVEDATRALAEGLPSAYRAGTSSWSFPGWTGLVYESGGKGPPSRDRIASEGLRAYAQHPLLRAVGLDRSFYAPLESDVFRRYASQVPDDFRFLVKAHEACVLARFPNHPRYGERGGGVNPLFFDPEYANEAVLGPTAEGLGPKLGAVLFQLPPQDERALGGSPERFADALYAFASQLLPEVPVAFELRNESLFGSAPLVALRDAGALHCLNAHPSMPRPAEQAKVLAAAGEAPGPRIVRWMLRAGFRYEEARDRYAPFDRLIDADPATRGAIASICRDALGEGREVLVIANNKAEGSAPRSVEKLAEALSGEAESAVD